MSLVVCALYSSVFSILFYCSATCLHWALCFDRLSLVCILRLPADDGTPLRKWITKQFKELLPNPTDVTKVVLDDARSARAWGHCTIRGCTATVSCAVNIQLDHALITCFQGKVHCHHMALEYNRSASRDLAATVSHKSPLKASAEVRSRMPAVPTCILPTRKEHQRARRCFLQKQPKRRASTCHAALA